MLIESSNRWFRATLDEVDEGIAVVLWRKMTRDGAMCAPLYRTVLEVPFHIACDRVHEVINELTPEAEAWPTRFRVLSVDGKEKPA
jgi:hypothetical protein